MCYTWEASVLFQGWVHDFMFFGVVVFYLAI